jgi:PilZ domain
MAMPQKLLDALMLRSCSHEFSWPRRAPDGHYYQVCTLCASEYKYDWDTMRRTERLEQLATEGSLPADKRNYKSTWMPRARRLKFVAPLRYRVKNLGNWADGTIENLSQSGLFFHGSSRLPANTLVEMIFEMPEEISGQKNSNVLCQGRVIRTKPAVDCPDIVELAVSILDYKFIRHN